MNTERVRGRDKTHTDINRFQGGWLDVQWPKRNGNKHNIYQPFRRRFGFTNSDSLEIIERFEASENISFIQIETLNLKQ